MPTSLAARLVLCLVPCLAGLASAQGPKDVLYYKFDETGGRTVVNHASSSGVAPAEGTLVGTYATTHVPGMLGPSALSGGTSASSAGSNYADTGWIPSLAGGDLTVAFFIKQRTAPATPSTTSYLFTANTATCRMFTGGAASRGLRMATWGGTPASLDTTQDVQTAAASSWLHVALVIDAAGLKATYYLNGVAQPPIPTNGGATLTGGSHAFHIGGYLSFGGLYDVDEFRVSLRAVPAAEIQAWASQTTAVSAPYGKGCFGATLAGASAPQVGNAAHALLVGGASGSSYLLALGASRLKLGALDLPIDLGLVLPALSGCHWQSSADVTLSGTLSGTSVSVPLAVPANPALNGVVLWCQALLSAPPSSLQSTNGLAVAIGQ